jgi:hypothetical protein
MKDMDNLPLEIGGLGIPVTATSSKGAFESLIGSTWHNQQATTTLVGFVEAVNFLGNLNIQIPILQVKTNLNITPPITHVKEYAQKFDHKG